MLRGSEEGGTGPGLLMRRGVVYDSPFVPPEALRFLTGSPLIEICARVRSRASAIQGRKCVCACMRAPSPLLP
jgi:hypothetical protein